MRALIIGCGYVGLPLGAELVRQGHTVYGLRRNSQAEQLLRESCVQPLIADITDPGALAKLPTSFDWVINTVGASGSTEVDYRQTYFEGTQNVLNWLAANPPQKYVWTSSTAVYAQDNGSLVNESSPTQPTSETAQVLLETERLLLRAVRESHFPAIILRPAGIYGPERGYYFKEFLKGTATIPGRGDRFANMIHRDDLVGIIIAAMQHGHAGQVYNAVDDEPVPILRLYHWLSEALGREMPPFVAGTSTDSRRTAGNKRVCNRKLKMELGYQFKYPTFRDGFTAEIQRLDDAGLL